MKTTTSRTEFGIYHTARIKQFPDGSGEILCANRAIFREPGYELSDKWDSSKREETGREIDHDAARERAQRRARSELRDLALSNDFKYFVTLTLDRARIDRYDIAIITRRLNTWLDNRVRRNGLQYILVPERHKDGAVHFHGFINDALRVVDSGTMIPPGGGKPRRPRSAAQRAAWAAEGGHTVYNLPGWDFGFTTAIELYGSYHSAVGYVCKYISKGQEKVGGRWFYHSSNLARPCVTLADCNIEDIERSEGAASFEIETLRGVRCALLRTDGEEVKE